MLGDDRRELIARHDPGVNRVLEVVGAVGDPVREGDDLSLGRAGAGRDQEWLRIPSRVSAHRLSGAAVTSAPQTAWSKPSGKNGDSASSLA